VAASAEPVVEAAPAEAPAPETPPARTVLEFSGWPAAPATAESGTMVMTKHATSFHCNH